MERMECTVQLTNPVTWTSSLLEDVLFIWLSSHKRTCCSSDKSSNRCWNTTLKCGGSAFECFWVLPVRKLNSHSIERKEGWLCLDSLTDMLPDCLVDSVDDAGSGIVLFYFLEVEHWGCLEITKTAIIALPSHGNGENSHWLLTAVCTVQ